MDNPKLFNTILKFRETQIGTNLRKEVHKSLNLNEGGEYIASINAGIKQNFSPNILKSSNKEFGSILISQKENIDFKNTPSVLINIGYADESLKLWRLRSKVGLEVICNSRNIKSDDLCPCNSGEKLKYCCYASLKN